MYQIIPDNISQILLKRALIFLLVIFISILAFHFYQAFTSSPASTYLIESSKADINKTDLVFSSFNVQ